MSSYVIKIISSTTPRGTEIGLKNQEVWKIKGKFLLLEPFCPGSKKLPSINQEIKGLKNQDSTVRVHCKICENWLNKTNVTDTAP